ncbi:XdhC family protein [Caloramator sp. Dgby_cultured_2]|uniref:XdhC family protein n=1 Tax=Caloramator sp. Dgby_cultured_2 TaxID=3029174 RepID=UPI00237D889C|nr:XdhC family protein [Caloramator sp. Dgby_cultured_2]WDU82385.1 XdhC family protein [Caloramator sp. Dgby_cultured_2]
MKVIGSREKLLIVGGGHVALELYKFAKLLNLYVVIFEDREEFGNRERFPEADEIVLGDIVTNLKNYPIDDRCFIVIVTRGHEYDEAALREVITRDAKYIGMIGSKNKVNYIFSNLKKKATKKP